MAHGKNLKRRGTQKVVRRTRNRLTFINKQLGDAKLRQRWDYKLTTRQNYARLGLVFNLNSVKKIGMGSAESKRQCDELFDIPDSDDLSNPRRGKHYMTDEEQLYIAALIQKHGEDYKAMERDIKLNSKQHTEAHLRRRCARYLLLHAAPAAEAGSNAPAEA